MSIKKVKKVVANMHAEVEHFMHIRNLDQALYRRLVLRKVCRIVKFNQKALLKPYIDMKKDLRKKVQTDFEKYLFLI